MRSPAAGAEAWCWALATARTGGVPASYWLLLRQRMFSLVAAEELGYGRRVQLTAKQKQYLKGLAHGLDPVVQVGTKGISETVVDQIRQQLAAHELIKVRFNTESAVEPADTAEDLALRTRSLLVQKAGRILVFYRRHDDKPKIELPSNKRPRSAAAG